MEKHYGNPALSSLDHLFSMRSFKKEFLKDVRIGEEEEESGKGKSKEFSRLSELDLKILLKYLSRDRGVAIVEKDVSYTKVKRKEVYPRVFLKSQSLENKRAWEI